MYTRCRNLASLRRGLLVVAAFASTAASASAQDISVIQAAKERRADVIQSLVRRGAATVNVTDGDGTTALHWAAHWGDAATVDLLLRSGANVNAATELGVTPLMLASMNGDSAVAGKLLDKGANVHAAGANGETPLMWSARTGSVEVVRRLLSGGADPNVREKVRGQTALMWAASENHPDVVRTLIEAGADVGARTPRGLTAILLAARDGAVDALRALHEGGANVKDALPDNTTVLLIAALSGRTAVVQWLLEAGADPNVADANGMTPLHAVFFRQTADPAMVRALLDHRANPNTRLEKGPPTLPHEIGSYQPLAGATPFVMAARAGDGDMMRVLVAAGADPKITTNNGATALMFAAGMGRFLTEGKLTGETLTKSVQAVSLAMELGVEVNAATTNGQTALHAAAGQGLDSVIELLAAKGATLQAKDRNGQTPRAVAERAVRDGGSPATVALLQKLGG